VLASPTLHGTLELHSDGSFTYTPNSHFNREDTFEYYVDDGTYESDPATVTITVATAFPWYNGHNRLNVNDDTLVTPIDALLIINALNRGESGRLPLERPRPLTTPFYDVNRDGYLSPIDALQVINYLNRGGDGEGEAAASLETTPVTMPTHSVTTSTRQDALKPVSAESAGRRATLDAASFEELALVHSSLDAMRSDWRHTTSRWVRRWGLSDLSDSTDLQEVSDLETLLELLAADVSRGLPVKESD
jgi:hypothetical protein